MGTSAAKRVTPTPTLAELNRLMVEGRVAEVRDGLQNFSPSAANRAMASEVANLAWRSGDPELGLRWLQRYVRPPARRPATPTIPEILEYAQCLIRVGAVAEGASLLDQVSEKEHPLALFYRAGIPIGRWDYSEAARLLERYCTLRSLRRYPRLVGQTNLAAAYVFTGRTKEAGALLRGILHETHLSGYRLLLMRALEISAENFFVKRKWEETERFLKASERAAVAVGLTLDSFFVEKFRTVVDLFRTGGSAKALAALKRLKEKALTSGVWETVRECDRLESVVGKDSTLARKVWFGTPYAGYRESLAAHFPDETFSEGSYVWTIKAGASRGILDLQTGEWEHAPSPVLLAGGVSLRLIRALAEDFYRSRRIAELFTALHPSSHFNIDSSPNVVNNALFRTRRVLAEAKIPLEIREANGFFFLHASEPMQIKVVTSAAGPLGEKFELELKKVAEHFGDRPFSLSQVEKVVKRSRRTALRLVQAAIESGQLSRSGGGRNVRYRCEPLGGAAARKPGDK